MQFSIMNHEETANYAQYKYNTPDVIISIKGNGEKPTMIVPQMTNSIHAVLYAPFESNDKLSERIAQEIAKFAKENAGIGNFIFATDCHHGQVLGMCAAIMKILTGSDDQVFENPPYEPDFHTYRMTINAFIDQLAEELAKN